MAELRADFDTDTPIDHNYHQARNAKVEKWESSLPTEYWDYRKKWEENPQNRVVGNFPIHIDIEATSMCNLKCIMCPRTDLVNAGEFWKIQRFDFDKYKAIIDEGVANGLCSIKYNYLGEPTLHPKIVEMVAYAKQAGVVDVMFNTNATMLTPELSRKLIEAGLDKLFFSFDSPYRDEYNRIREGGDFDEVLANMRGFVKVRDEMGSITPFVRASIVRMKDNEEHWDELWEDYKNLLEPFVESVAYIDYLEHSSQSGTTRTVVEQKGREKKFCCPQLWQRMFVHPDGIATVCCIDTARELQVGNVNEQSPKEIWTGPEYQRLRDIHASGRFEEIPTCARCPLAKY